MYAFNVDMSYLLYSKYNLDQFFKKKFILYNFKLNYENIILSKYLIRFLFFVLILISIN